MNFLGLQYNRAILNNMAIDVLRTRTPLGELIVLPHAPLLDLRGPNSNGGDGRGRKGKGKGRQARKGNGGIGEGRRGMRGLISGILLW